MLYDITLTDTFGGEANFAWVRRAQVSASTRRGLMRAAKAAVGITGAKGRLDDYGDSLDFRPYGACLVMFVIPAEESAS
tara:strand:- start:1838 stop:2074 length:237 start_codon:yes stop_codon:yes gene_type:complete